MTSAKFLGFLTHSLPLSELVIFAYTPPALETSYLGSTPPYCIVTSSSKEGFAALHRVSLPLTCCLHLNQEKKVLNGATNVVHKYCQNESCGT